MSPSATIPASVSVRSASRRRLPLGFGLRAAAVASLALWAGLFWLAGNVV